MRNDECDSIFRIPHSSFRICPGATMATLYVIEQGARIEKEYRRVIVTKEDETLLAVPLLHVDHVVLVGNTWARRRRRCRAIRCWMQVWGLTLLDLGWAGWRSGGERHRQEPGLAAPSPVRLHPRACVCAGGEPGDCRRQAAQPAHAGAAHCPRPCGGQCAARTLEPGDPPGGRCGGSGDAARGGGRRGAQLLLPLPAAARPCAAAVRVHQTAWRPRRPPAATRSTPPA